MTGPEELHRCLRVLEAEDDPAAWGALALLAPRLGLEVPLLTSPEGASRLLGQLAARPTDRALAGLLELALPVTVLPEGPPPGPWEGGAAVRDHGDHPYDPESGLPLFVRLEPSGEALRLTRDRRGWEGVAPLDQEALAARGHGAPLPYPRSHCRGSLAWFRVAEYAQRATDALRREGALPSSWELRLPRHKGRRHTFKPADHRLVLAPARRRRPPRPRVRSDGVYVAVDGSGFRRWLLFGADGTLAHCTHQSYAPAAVRDRLERPGQRRQGDRRGRWTLEGRELSGWVGQGGGPFLWEGFVGDDGGLYLRSTSRITGHQAANVWRVAHPRSR